MNCGRKIATSSQLVKKLGFVRCSQCEGTHRTIHKDEGESTQP